MRNIRLIAILFFTVLLFQQVPSSYALEGNWGPMENLSEGQAVATTIIGEIEPQWGTASPVVHTLSAWQFMPLDQASLSRIGYTNL